MMHNKKGLLEIGMTIYIILIATIMFIFSAIFMFESTGQYGIDPLLNISQDLHNASLISTDMLTHETDLANDYHNLNWYPDFFTMYALLMGFITTVIAALKVKKFGFVGFVGWLTVGSYIFLLIGSLIFQFIKWFWSQYFEKLFFDLAYSVLFTEWVIEFSAPLLFGWWIILVFLSQFEFRGKSKGNQFDIDEIDDDEVFGE